MPSNLKKIGTQPGIFYRESTKKRYRGAPDRCFYVLYKNNAKKLVREKVGWASEGYNAKMAVHIRSERMRTLRHGKELTDKNKVELTLDGAWTKYDEWLETGKKHVYDDRNRYKNYIKPRFGTNALSQIKTHDLEKFKATLLKKGLYRSRQKTMMSLLLFSRS